MAQNLECKIPVASFTEYEKRLKKINAEYKGTLNQKDIYFTYDKGLLKLRSVNGSYELIKYNRNEDGGDRFCDYHILNLSGGNAETYLSDILSTEAVVEKKRELYLYKGSRIHLDTVRDLGNYIEIETIVTGGEEDARQRFDEIVTRLRLDLGGQIKTSYRNLIEQALR